MCVCVSSGDAFTALAFLSAARSSRFKRLFSKINHSPVRAVCPLSGSGESSTSFGTESQMKMDANFGKILVAAGAKL